jgi:hypothetical protein
MQNEESWVIPEVVIYDLTRAKCSIRKMTWFFDWLTNNQDKVDALVEILRQLDDPGKLLFFRSIVYRHPQGKAKDPLNCAARALASRKVTWHTRDVRKYYQTHWQKTITLSNGVQCDITTKLNQTRWYAQFKCAGTVLKCELNINQLVFIEDNAPQNARMLKRIKPLSIQYLKDGGWHFLRDCSSCYLAMASIAENVPFEIAVLVT